MKDSATGSMTVIPWKGDDTFDRKSVGTLLVNTDNFQISSKDTSGLINKALYDARVVQGLVDKKNLSLEEVAELTAAAASQLWVASSKGLAALYELAIHTYTNGWYIASLTSFGGRPYDPNNITSNELQVSWDLWVDQVMVETGKRGNIAQVRSDMCRYIPAVCNLPAGKVQLLMTKTGENSARVEVNGVVFEIDDIRDEKVPVPFSDLRPLLEVEVGDTIEIEKESGPETFAERTSLIRELGPLASAPGLNRQKAEELAGLAAAANTYGIRKHISNPNSGGNDVGKDRMVVSVAESGEIIMVLHPSSSGRQAWAISQLSPQFKLTEEV